MQQHDEGQIETFLRDHFGTLAPGETIEIRAIPLDSNNKKDRKQAFFTTPEAAASWTVTHTSPLVELYYGINPRFGRGGTTEDVSRIVCAWADLDFKHFASEDEAMQVVDGFDLVPTTIVKTGGGLHLYWALREPLDATENPGRMRAMLERLYYRLGRLDAVHDLARIFRLPGTWNNKGEYGQPKAVRRVFHDASAAYTIEEFEKCLPILPIAERSAPTRLSTASENGASSSIPSEEEMATILSFIPPTLPYSEYLSIWMGVASAYPDERGLALMDAWSSEARADNGQYSSPRTQPEKHRQFRRQGVGIGTVIHYAKQGGYIPPSPPVPQIVRKHKGAKAMPGECGDTLVITSLSTVAPVPIRWLWPRWLARGKVTILGGHPGDGKSTLTASLAATLSRGGVWPDGIPATQGKTLFLLAEDALDDTLRPRLDRLGADVSRVSAIEAVRNPEGQDRAFSIERHLHQLEAAIVEHGFDLLVIDPLTSFMQQSDRNGEGDVRDLLTPLGKMAERTGAAILGIMHVGKPNGTSRRPVQQLLGATAFGAVARSVWMIAPLSQAQGETHRVLGVVKSNLSMKPPSLEWSMEEDTPIAWHGPTEQDIAELLGGGRPATKRDEAGDMIRDLLAAGPLLNNDLHDRCEAAGISTATRRRAERTIGTETWKEPRQDGRFWTGLPGQKETWFSQWHRGVITTTDVAHLLYT
jgi:energy-coupling factor transporter ATP-binding protein EcfA2